MFDYPLPARKGNLVGKEFGNIISVTLYFSISDTPGSLKNISKPVINPNVTLKSVVNVTKSGSLGSFNPGRNCSMYRLYFRYLKISNNRR